MVDAAPARIRATPSSAHVTPVASRISRPPRSLRSLASGASGSLRPRSCHAVLGSPERGRAFRHATARTRPVRCRSSRPGLEPPLCGDARFGPSKGPYSTALRARFPARSLSVLRRGRLGLPVRLRAPRVTRGKAGGRAPNRAASHSLWERDCCERAQPQIAVAGRPAGRASGGNHPRPRGALPLARDCSTCWGPPPDPALATPRFQRQRLGWENPLWGCLPWLGTGTRCPFRHRGSPGPYGGFRKRFLSHLLERRDKPGSKTTRGPAVSRSMSAHGGAPGPEDRPPLTRRR